MARHARIEYPGAIYHVINRGNYRRDVFDSPGAAKSFVKTLEETVKRFDWELGAYVVMRNHFHLAVRTLQPNLSAGMQWLQVTFAARFNRMRGEQGHLFQGRFKSFLLQDEAVWAKVADYIHLNPERAAIVELAHLDAFRWSSLLRYVQNKRFMGLKADDWMATIGLKDTPEGWREYHQHLRSVRAREGKLPEEERESFSSGWAFGDDDWKNGLLAKKSQVKVGAPRAEYVEPKELMERRWALRLREIMAKQGLSESDLAQRISGTKWKVAIADQLQREMGVPVVWLANALKWGRPASVRTSLWRHRRNADKVTT
ncbi:transposase [Synoicihabitans lomoniglobus]|uniref:Transposase n=1 Tax=Synoicihabitans lomoniglobus TaxID=2909285 RepID=A0AAF0CR89_9BACT|nr:transposase [Opitutaceae bacterium LMO-M01]WED66581.1 transposase [Opitutaceae bacterium LMO-M01]